MHPEVGAGGELNFWNQRGAAWHGSGAIGNEKAFLAKAAADYVRRVACDRTGCSAGDGQDAVQFPLGRIDPSGIPARNHHSLPPRKRRHGAIDPPNSFPSQA